MFRPLRKSTEGQQGLKVGDRALAREAFGQVPGAGEAGVKRAGTNIKYEQPGDVSANSPPQALGSTMMASHSGERGVETVPSESRGYSSIASHVEKGIPAPVSSCGGNWSTGTSYSALSPRSETMNQPPPYSPRAESSTATSISRPPITSNDTDRQSLATIESSSNGGVNSVRVKTKGADLKSGFPYHPALFDLRVHPDKWTSFTEEVIGATKLNLNDHAQVWAAATGVAITGLIGTSVYVGRTVKRSVRERKVKEGMTNMSDGGLGDVLQQWNMDYFKDRGLFVHLELSESAMKNPDQKSNVIRKHTLMYRDKADRERKKDERKYVIVVTRLDSDGQPTDALNELEAEEKAQAVEIGTSGEMGANIAELPGDAESKRVELPADMEASLNKPFSSMDACVEMDSDNTHLLEKLQIEEQRFDESPDSPTESQANLRPEPLIVRPNETPRAGP